MKKILFTGANFQNKGSAAMIISTLKIFRELIPDVEFVSATIYPKFDRERAKKYGLRICEYQFAIRNFLKPLLSMASELVNANVIVDLSGFVFSDKTRKTGILIRGMTILLCRLFRKPVVLYSQSIGPFNSRFTRLFCKICLQRANVIVIRGKISKRYLHGLGIRKNVYVYTDSAFLLEPVPQNQLNEILDKENIRKRKDLQKIGIAVNTRIYERTEGLGTENYYINVMAQLSDFLVEDLNAEIVFIPYEITPTGYDDRFVARTIYKKTRKRHRIHLIENEYAPEELKALTKIFDLFIGCRFHSIVASTSMHVPTIAIGWSHKYLETMEVLGQAKYVCDYKDLSQNYLITLIKDALCQRKDIKKELKAKLKEAKNSAIKNAKLVAKMID